MGAGVSGIFCQRVKRNGDGAVLNDQCAGRSRYMPHPRPNCYGVLNAVDSGPRYGLNQTMVWSRENRSVRSLTQSFHIADQINE